MVLEVAEGEPAVTYTAPASKLLTVLHVADEAAPEDEPRTRCGLEMAPEEMWLDVEMRAGDACCRQCQGLSDGQEPMW